MGSRVVVVSSHTSADGLGVLGYGSLVTDTPWFLLGS